MRINLKTDSRHLIDFGRRVAKVFGLKILEDIEDVHGVEGVDVGLKIKTHYEGLNISRSNVIFYLAFELGGDLENKEKEEVLKEGEGFLEGE